MYREGAVRCGFSAMRFYYYKTANRTTPCGVVRCNAVWCSAVMPFYERFWCDFYDLCGLCGLVNTPSHCYVVRV